MELLEAVRILLGKVPVAAARPTIAFLIKEKPWAVTLNYEWIQVGTIQQVLDKYPKLDVWDGQEHVSIITETNND
jgi:hypothetical protein